MTIPEGTILQHVYVRANPNDEVEYIGDIILDSELTTSYFGDTQLFYKHQNFKDDLGFKPEWGPYTPVFGSDENCGCPYLRMKKSALAYLGGQQSE